MEIKDLWCWFSSILNICSRNLKIPPREKIKKDEHSSSLHTQSTDNKARMMTVVNYLSIVRVELCFFRFSRIFLPPYLLPIHIVMSQYILLIKYLYLYFLLWMPESCVTLLSMENFLFFEFYKLLQVFTLLRLKNYLGLLTKPLNALCFSTTDTAVHLCHFSSDKDLQVLDLISWDKTFHFWMFLHIYSFQILFLNRT